MRQLPFPLSVLRSGWGAPEIGRKLPTKFAEGTQVFDQRLKCLFPVGSPEQDMVRELERQGFTRSPAHNGVEFADFTRSELITQTHWLVRWRTREGRITEIWGIYGCTAP